jgi:hypothetical protein
MGLGVVPEDLDEPSLLLNIDKVRQLVCRDRESHV